MRKKAVPAIILIVILAVFSFLVYANNVLLPTKLKAKITQELEKNIGKSVQIDTLRYDIFKGLIIHNLVISDAPQNKAYLSVKDASFNFLLFPLLQKKFVIPLLRIDTPQAQLTLRQDNTLDILDLLPKAKNESKQKFRIIILKVVVSNGLCKFTDEHITPRYIKEINNLNIGLGLSPDARIKFLLDGKIINSNAAPTYLSASGEYNLFAPELNAGIKVNNIIINDYLLYLKSLPIGLSDGSAAAELAVRLKDKLLAVKGDFTAAGTKLRRKKYGLVADINAQADIQYDLQNAAYKNYRINFRISNGVFYGFNYLKDILAIQGNVNLEKDKLWSDNLKAMILDSPVDIKGSLENFSRPFLKLNLASGQVNLEKAKQLFPNLLKNIALNGKASLVMEIKGTLDNPPLAINVVLDVDSAVAAVAGLKEPLGQIKGRLKFSGHDLNWERFSFIYKDTPYQTQGALTDYKQPKIDFRLASPQLFSRTILNIKDDVARIALCTGKYKNSKFWIKGAVATNNNWWDLNIAMDLALKDTYGLLPENIGSALKKLKLDANWDIKGSIKGNPKDMPGVNALLRITSPALSISGLKLADFSFTLEQDKGLLNIGDLSATAYGAQLKMQFLMNFTPKIPSYSARLAISDLDLAKLKMDTGLKDKDLKGLLGLKCNIQADTQGLDTMKGSGSILIRDGKLWELNLFKGLGELLFIPIYQKITFNDAEGFFTIQDKNIRFYDVFFGSNKINLAGQGKIGFNGSLDLSFQTEINETLIKESPDLRKFTSLIVGNLLAIKVQGTLNKPEYKAVPATKELIQSVRHLFSLH